MSWSTKIKGYFDAAYVPDPRSVDASSALRANIRWWMELLRNLLVVTTITFLAHKSNNILPKIVAYFSIGALFLYFYTYSRNASFHFFPFVKDPKRHAFINEGVWAIVRTAILFALFAAFMSVFEELGKLAQRC
jgi:protein-S-isoprenylcysteine O-methyltransferase Ste14